MLSVLIEWLVTVGLGFALLFVSDWLTGRGVIFSGPNQDERKRAIKQKSIVQSWLTLLFLLAVNFVRDYLHLGQYQLDPLRYPELFYAILAIFAYFIFYWHNSKKMSASFCARE